MTKHILLGAAAAITLSPSLSAVSVLGQLPDMATPMHLIVESEVATVLGLTAAKDDTTIDVKAIIDELTSTEHVLTGAIFENTLDLKALFSSDMVDQLQTNVNPDSLVYVGKKFAQTGDEDIGDDETVMLAIGPQAQAIFDKFKTVGSYSTIGTKEAHSMLLDLTAGGISVGNVPQQVSATAGAKSEPVDE